MLKLSDTNKKHLSYLTEQEDNVLKNFCRLAWDYLAKGPNLKFYTSAAQELNISVAELQDVVEAVVNLLSEACKSKTSVVKFRAVLNSIGFNESQVELLTAFYTTKREDINNVLLAASVQLPMFKDLEWRAEIEIGSRALPEQITPNVLLKLHLENSGSGKLLLLTDPGNLECAVQVLDNALSEANSQHTSRVKRRFKT